MGNILKKGPVLITITVVVARQQVEAVHGAYTKERACADHNHSGRGQTAGGHERTDRAVVMIIVLRT